MFARQLLRIILGSTPFLPTDSHIVWSPGNTCANPDGSVVVTQNGTYFKTGFSGTSIALTIDVSTYQHNSIPSDGWGQWIVTVDGSAPEPVAVAPPGNGSDTTVILAGNLPSGDHNVEAWFDLRDETDTYAPKDAQILKTVSLDQGAALASPTGVYTPLDNRMMIMGDSITKGYKAVDPSGASTSSNYPLSTFAFTLGQALHCECGIVGESGQGWAHNSNGWNEVFPTAFNNYFTGHPRVWPTGLKYLVVAEGTNDAGDVTSAVTAWLPKARMIVGQPTWIVLVAPFNGSRRSELEGAAAAYRSSSGDAKVLVAAPSSVLSTANSGAFFTVDGIHPQPLLHPIYGALLAGEIARSTATPALPAH